MSTIEQLPDNCDEDIAWANLELRERKMPQTEILNQFNARLADKGIRGVSKGAFSRWSVRTAIELRKMEQSRAVTNAVLERMPSGERSDSTLAAIELVKFRLIETIMGEAEADPKLLGQASLALMRLSSTALREAEGKRRDSRDQRDQATRDREQVEREKAAAEVAEVGAKAGVGSETLAKITRLLTTGSI